MDGRIVIQLGWRFGRNADYRIVVDLVACVDNKVYVSCEFSEWQIERMELQ